MDKEDVVYIYIYSGTCSAIKEEWNNTICSNMNGPRDYHTKWNTSDRERQISYESTNIRTLTKNATKELTHRTETDSNFKMKIYGYQRKNGRGGINQEVGISIYTLLYTK